MEEVNKNDQDIEVINKDVVVVGSGIAGVYTALEVNSDKDIAIITKETLEMSNSVLAQGGIAVSLDEKNDSPALHFKDTLFAGAGLCDNNSVWVLVQEAAQNIMKICSLGVNFDKNGAHKLALTREGAHSVNRIIHAGDTTGKEVCDKLIAVAQERDNISIHERSYAVELAVKDDKCHGVYVFDVDTCKIRLFRAPSVVIATGGFGQIYSHTSNPEVATGDGVAMCLRAGAVAMDMEFIQFHPTVLYLPQDKSFLISEAVRGEGAQLKNINGERFMKKYHELGELAPRDVVSRAIFQEMTNTNTDHVFIDITFKTRDYLENRFPNIFKTCFDYGIDMSKDYIPVAPAEHYCMGGIRTDVHGRTNVQGLYACGEVACTGIHGANRLASNSLLEGLVFGHKIAADINEKKPYISDYEPVTLFEDYDISNLNDNLLEDIKKKLQITMTKKVGIIRNRESLSEAAEIIEQLKANCSKLPGFSLTKIEIDNMLLVAGLVIEAALQREESRGAHYRSDFSNTDDINWRRSIIKSIKQLQETV